MGSPDFSVSQCDSVYNETINEEKMKYFYLTKWIQELNIEIEKAKKEQNLAKLLDLRQLKEQLIKLRDGG